MQTLNIQFASANTASEKSTVGKKSEKASEKCSASFESVLKSVSESKKSKKAEVLQSAEKSPVKKAVSEKVVADKASPEDARLALNESDTVKSEAQATLSNPKESPSGKTSEKEKSAEEENTIEVVFDLSALQDLDAETESLQAASISQVQSPNVQVSTEVEAEEKTEEVEPLALISDALSLENAEESQALEEETAFIDEKDIPLMAEKVAEDTVADTESKVDRDSSKELSLEKEDSKHSKEGESQVREKQGPTNPVFTIVDERTAVEGTKEEKLELKEDSLQKVSVSSAESQNISQDALRTQVQQNILSTSSQSAGATGSNFQAMLSQQIQENAPEFVKAGSIVLRDNNSGTINMTMKPESLGNVKISLEVSDKVIAGQITVHSQEAYDAFKQNLDTLKQAFQQNGFDSAGFTLNLAHSGSGNSGAFAQEQQQMAQEFMSNKTYGQLASTGESSVQEAEGAASYSKSSPYQIDVVA